MMKALIRILRKNLTWNPWHTKYPDTDNENCVIYYPGIRGSKDDYKDKDIPISIRISANSLKSLIESLSAQNYCYETEILS